MFLDKLDIVFARGNVEMDSQDSRSPAYETILTKSMAYGEGRRPAMLPEGGASLSQSPELARNSGGWMEDAKRIAVAGYKQVFEDGPKLCSSESEAEHRDHDENRTDERTYTPDMIGSNGKPDFERAELRTEQANALRAAGREEDHYTVAGKG
jgi:hypothetical protein